MESTDAPQIYVGLNEQHNPKWVEKGWKEQNSPEFPEELQELNIDQTITNIVKETIERGGNEVVVLDVGSGSEGYVVKAFADKEQFPELHKLLGESSGVTLRVIGVTAASRETNQGTLLSKDETEIPNQERQSSKIVTENYAYTITKAHTLDKFLASKYTPKIKLAFSTFGVGYLTPANFDQCLTDVADNLADGGKFYGISWDAVPAGATRGYFGLHHMATRPEPDNPVNKVFGGLSSNAEFNRFYGQEPEKQVDEFLGAIEFMLTKRVITFDQAKDLLTKRDVLPTPAFVREFHTYSTEKQQNDVLNKIKKYASHQTWLSEFDWDKKSDLIDAMKKAQHKDYEKHKDDPEPTPRKSLIPEKWLKRFKKTSSRYDQERDLEIKVWNYIEKNYAEPSREVVVKQKSELDKKIMAQQSWEDVVTAIKSLDQKTVAGFWDWNRIMRDCEQLFIDRQADKTTNFKVSTIEGLSKRPDLNVYYSKFTGSHGQNLYIGKKAAG